MAALIEGPAPSLPQVLQAREDRVAMQQQLLGRGGSLLCFNINIPGVVKNCPLSRRLFEAGRRAVLGSFGPELLEEVLWDQETGLTAFWRVDLPARALKARTCGLEEAHPLGRLWDLDVLGPEGAVSRRDLGLEGRSCLLCGAPGSGCARIRAHTPAQLLEKMTDLYLDWEAARLGALARAALLAEVDATPKPGLVDRENTGAHRDMDHGSFCRSAEALAPHFEAMARAGMEQPDFPALLTRLRVLGMAAEQDMYAATGGVNTHKGAVFSLGLLCGAAGRRAALGLEQEAEALCADVAAMTAGICEKEFAGVADKKNPTKGEQMYLRYGVTGARGQAESGFADARRFGLPAMKAAFDRGWSVGDACLAALVALMARVPDTNVLARKDLATARWLRDRMLGRKWDHAALRALDAQLTDQNISPGGSADLVAVSYWLCRYDAMARGHISFLPEEDPCTIPTFSLTWR